MRLIDADKLEMSLNEKLDAAITRNADCIGEIEYYSSLAALIAVTDCISNVNEQPTVEVVRCKDCTHWTSENGWRCEMWNRYVSDEKFFCGFGERREDDGTDRPTGSD